MSWARETATRSSTNTAQGSVPGRLPEETEKKLLKDVDRLSRQPFGSAEASVLRNYLDTVLDMPWGVETKERVSVETGAPPS